jgi:hypothetical protein
LSTRPRVAWRIGHPINLDSWIFQGFLDTLVVREGSASFRKREDLIIDKEQGYPISEDGCTHTLPGAGFVEPPHREAMVVSQCPSGE